MAAIEAQVAINAPIEKVYQYLLDFPKHSEWAAHPLALTQAGAGPVVVGTRFDSVGHMMSKDFHDQVEVTEAVPNERIGFEVDSGNNRLRYRFTLRLQGSATVLTKSVEPLRMGFPFIVVAPILAITGVFKKGIQGDLERIRAKLE